MARLVLRRCLTKSRLILLFKTPNKLSDWLRENKWVDFSNLKPLLRLCHNSKWSGMKPQYNNFVFVISQHDLWHTHVRFENGRINQNNFILSVLCMCFIVCQSIQRLLTCLNGSNQSSLCVTWLTLWFFSFHFNQSTCHKNLWIHAFFRPFILSLTLHHAAYCMSSSIFKLLWKELRNVRLQKHLTT